MQEPLQKRAWECDTLCLALSVKDPCWTPVQGETGIATCQLRHYCYQEAVEHHLLEMEMVQQEVIVKSLGGRRDSHQADCLL
jgi:hypothetical protein